MRFLLPISDKLNAISPPRNIFLQANPPIYKEKDVTLHKNSIKSMEYNFREIEKRWQSQWV
ncbi:MAG: hypothetical protein MSS89_03525, partial [Prevotella sp.]|nr:hypothetical protein [Prevotella sp.]